MHTSHDVGFFETVLAAYNNHWTLRTCPEDWWFCIVRKVAQAVDDNSKSEKVRKFFVGHDEKKELIVNVGSSIYGVDYSFFFGQMTGLISDNIKVPKYVDTMTSDFSSTTSDQKIISQIAIMTSLQEFFLFKGGFMCGIPSVEMSGQEKDWLKLVEKFQALRMLLQPIRNDLKLHEWWETAEGVLLKLVDTYNGRPDKEWWAKIIDKKGEYSSGHHQNWTGWFFTDFLGEHNLVKWAEFRSGLVCVPMNVTDGTNTEDSALVAGIAVVEANHGWVMLLEPNSIFRAGMETWEKNISSGG